jgi:DNA-binding beta-propeller fold protein YncE
MEKLGTLVLGKKNTPLVKPVAAMHVQNDLWVLGQGNGTIYRINNNKISGITDRDHPTFPSLVCVCPLKDSGVLVTDSFLEQVLFIRTGTDKPTLFSNNIPLQRPTGIAYCSQTDQVWIVETGAHRISIFKTDGTYIKSIGERGASPGSFNFPTHITIDDQGTAYVVDGLNYRIQIFDQSGELLSGFGKQGITSGCLARPKGIATDSQGNIYVADALFHCIQIFNRKGELLLYFGNQGTGREEFWMPAGLFIDGEDKIYVSDTYNNRVQVFQLLTTE